MAQKGEAVEHERLGEQVDVACEHLERERLRVDPLAPSLAALVHVEEAKLVAERIEPGPEGRVVEPRPAVEDDQREAAPDLLDEHPVPVGQPNLHRRSLRLAVDPDERVQLAVLGLEELADAAEAGLLEGAERSGVANVGIRDAGGRRGPREDDVAHEGSKHL
jgi:hypothetical protein